MTDSLRKPSEGQGAGHGALSLEDGTVLVEAQARADTDGESQEGVLVDLGSNGSGFRFDVHRVVGHELELREVRWLELGALREQAVQGQLHAGAARFGRRPEPSILPGQIRHRLVGVGDSQQVGPDLGARDVVVPEEDAEIDTKTATVGERSLDSVGGRVRHLRAHEERRERLPIAVAQAAVETLRTAPRAVVEVVEARARLCSGDSGGAAQCAGKKERCATHRERIHTWTARETSPAPRPRTLGSTCECSARGSCVGHRPCSFGPVEPRPPGISAFSTEHGGREKTRRALDEACASTR